MIKTFKCILLLVGILVAILVVTKCSKVETFETTIDSIKSNQLIVNCSNEVNRNKININDIGYYCNVLVTEETVFRDTDNSVVEMSDLKAGDHIKIYLIEPIDISVENRTFEAKQINKMK